MVRGPRTAMKSGPRLLQLEKALAQQRRPNTAKNKLKKKKSLAINVQLQTVVTFKKKKNEILWECSTKEPDTGVGVRTGFLED